MGSEEHNSPVKSSDFEVILLGTGTCVPSAERSQSSYAVMIQKITLLLDCGSGTLRRMVEAGVDYRTVDGICLTHFHPDHVSDLIPFLLATKYTPDFHRTKPLLLLGPRGIQEYLDSQANIFGSWMKELDFPLEVHELENDQMELKSVTLSTIATGHTSNSIGYRLETPDHRTLAYTGDTDDSPAILNLASQVDLLVIECSFPHSKKVAGHLTPEEVGRIARNARCKRVVLTHLYPAFSDLDPGRIVQKYFSGEVIVGKDLMKVKI